MYTLYTFCRSSTAWRARIALQLKKIKPKYQFVHLFKSEQKQSKYLKVNPNHGVPALVLPDGTVIIESLAILQFLNQVHPQPNNLYPGGPVKRAQIRGFCEVINAGLHPYQNLRLLEELQSKFNADRKQWTINWLNRGLGILEKMLENNNHFKGKYAFGDNITAADVVFYPQVHSAKYRWKVDVTPFSRVSHLLENLQKIQQFIDSAPQKQPDFKDL